jgi:PEP-CTERM motif
MSLAAKRLIIFKLFIFAILGFSFGIAQASPILYGAVSFDANTGLYTYSYALDNTNGTLPITEVSILVQDYGHPPPAGMMHSPLIWPVAHTSAAGWNFVNSFGGISPEPVGAFYAWQAQDSGAVLVGSTLFGFSFTLDLAPTNASFSNYFLFGENYFLVGVPEGRGDVLEIGNIVAPLFPNIPIPTVPEPSTWAMLLIGFAGIGFAAYQKSNPRSVVMG